MTTGFFLSDDGETVDMDEQTRIDQENSSEGTVDEDATAEPDEDEDSDIDEESEEEPTDKD